MSSVQTGFFFPFFPFFARWVCHDNQGKKSSLGSISAHCRENTRLYFFFFFFFLFQQLCDFSIHFFFDSKSVSIWGSGSLDQLQTSGGFTAMGPD